MVDFNLYFAFIIAAILAVATPGPSVLFIVARSINLGIKGGLLSVIGIEVGALCHATAVSLGLAQLLEASPEYFVIVKNLGCIYLIFLGLKTILTRKVACEENDSSKKSGIRLFRQAFLVEILNPKEALFYLALLPQFTNKSLGHVEAQLLILCITVVGIGLISDCTYAIMAGHIGNSLKKSNLFKKIEKYFSGSIYCSLGVLGLCYKVGKE